MIQGRRKRRIAADEAHSWARNLQLRNPYAKLLLTMLTLYVNGDGSCFVSIAQLAEDCEFAPETVRRRLLWLESIGAIVRMPQWRDESGRLNTEGRGKRTTDEIRLMIDGDPDDIETAARSGKTDTGEENSNSETSEISHSPRKVGTCDDEEQLAPPLATQQPPNCGGGLISEPEPEPSPQPPSGGSFEIEGWKDFEKDWPEPILRQSLAQQVWCALKPEERNLARQAARGYFAWRKRQKNPPNVLGAHIFLKERDAWPKFAERDPLGSSTVSTGVTVDSDAGRAILAIYAVARARPFESQRRIVYPGEITPQMLAFAEAGNRSSWPWIEDRQQIGAWTNFLATHVHGARPALVTTRGIGADQRPGIYAPWPWPPRKDGSLSSTGPPEALMTDQDLADFK
jgi:helix-turn-helix protein